MQLKEIISVPGMTGLFKVVASNKNGVIVESLQDSKRTMISSTQRIMTLTDIALYIKDGEMPLRDVFKKIKEKSGDKLEVDPKEDPEKLRAYFKKLIPEFDEEKVYASEIKKMLSWYDALKDKIDFSKIEEEEDSNSLLPNAAEQDKQVRKVYESHGPKTEHAKTTTTKTRKKV
jgi:hypothetical protein